MNMLSILLLDLLINNNRSICDATPYIHAHLEMSFNYEANGTLIGLYKL